jgi:hypothetical protein
MNPTTSISQWGSRVFGDLRSDLRYPLFLGMYRANRLQQLPPQADLSKHSRARQLEARVSNLAWVDRQYDDPASGNCARMVVIASMPLMIPSASPWRWHR